MSRFAEIRDTIAAAGDAPRFRSDPVPYVLLAEILDDATSRLPNRFDEPPWRFLVVVERERELLIARIAEALARHWGLGPLPPRGLASDAVLSAPALVLVFSAVPSSEGLEAFGLCAGAAQNAILLAQAAGLATHRLYTPNVVPEVVLDFVGQRLGPALRSGELVTTLAIGFPAAEPELADVDRSRSLPPTTRPPSLPRPPPHPEIQWIGRVDRAAARWSSPPEEVARPAPVLRASRGERVFIADAYPFNREHLGALLAAGGYSVEAFSTGAALRARVQGGQPDLYLLSESMPDGGGFELVRQLVAGGSPAPIVVTTARRDSNFRIAGLSAGVEYYLRKPVNPIELYTAARILLERRRLVEELQRKNQDLGRLLGELRAAQARLVQQARMASLGQLVAGVAHDVNTPLGAVVSNNDLFLRAFARLRAALPRDGRFDEPTREQVERDLEAVEQLTAVTREACLRITGIVRNLRTFARLEDADLTAADLHEGLEATLPLIAHVAKPGTRIVCRYGVLPRVECHRNQLNQVFMNLLVNACQSIEDVGTITITTATDGPDRVRVSIGDSGRGIAPEHLERIFDPGFTTKSTGVGLGLMICYQIVEAHGGQITVESELGRGTTFTVTLPVRQSLVEPRAAASDG